jgi:hypothetical protein
MKGKLLGQWVNSEPICVHSGVLCLNGRESREREREHKRIGPHCAPRSKPLKEMGWSFIPKGSFLSRK